MEEPNITSLTVILIESNIDDSGDTQEAARWQQPEEDGDLSFDESFTSNKYAGSFRLRYSTGNASSRRGDTPTTTAKSNGEGTEEESMFSGNGILGDPQNPSILLSTCMNALLMLWVPNYSHMHAVMYEILLRR